VAGVIAASLASAATAAVSLRPPAGVPDPKAMVLLSSDLKGASVSAQRYFKDADFPSVISYTREFEGGSVGSADLLTVESQAEIGTSTRSTARFLGTLRRLFGSKTFRQVIKETFEEEFSGEVGAAELKLVIGRPQRLGAGDDGFDLAITVRAQGIQAVVHLTTFRVERVLGLLVTTGAPGERLLLSHVRQLAAVMADRMRAELAPVVTRVPTILGNAQEGQTLTASKGTWLHKPTGYTYQWRRCNATGDACSAIPGATGATTTLTAADVGSTIRVAVTAKSSVGSATAVSAQTALVVPSAPPSNTEPPAVTGLAQQGETLTGSTGTWSGNPTSYAYQWQRCDAAAASCVNVTNAIGQTYVVGPGDAGFRLRVSVTATNAAGSTAAVSLPTGAVP
jgi:hypothetical protein